MLDFSSESTILPTPLLRFYLQNHAKVEIKWAIHYVAAKPLEDFILHQTDLRIKADSLKQPHKSKMAKQLMNSCYGR